MRSTLLPFVVFLVLGGCGKTPTGGGVLVRWRLIDGVSGTNVTRCKSGGPLDSHYCCGNVAGTDITIERLRLRAEVVNADGSIGADGYCPTCCFACNPFEYTTEFELPLARYRLSLEAYSCGVHVGHTPAPLVRDVTQVDDLVDLYVQEVALFPSDTAAGCLHGAPVPAACPPLSPQSPSVDLASEFPTLDLSLPD